MIFPLVIAILIAFTIIAVLKDPFTWISALVLALCGGGWYLWETTDWHEVFGLAGVFLLVGGMVGIAFAIHDWQKLKAWAAPRLAAYRKKTVSGWGFNNQK